MQTELKTRMTFFYKFFLLGALFVWLPLAAGAKPANKPAAKLPPRKELKQMIKRALLDWNKAVQSRDFTGFYNGAATIFKKNTSLKKMRSNFKGFIDKKINIKSIQNLEPVFEPAPKIGKVHGVDGVLQLSGTYKTKPEMTQFTLMYVREKSTWKLAQISVYIGSGAFMASDGEME
jgi:hypothetical protein